MVAGETVTVRLTEVEAYHGRGTGAVPDPGSHARMGPTARNATMWGEPGHLYVYLSHGIHSCVNVVCGPRGSAGGILLRGGEVIDGSGCRGPPPSRPRRDARATWPADRAGWATRWGCGIRCTTASMRSPGPCCTGHPLDSPCRCSRCADVATGPRVGVAGAAGTAPFPWRFWIPGDPTVSAFRWGHGAARRRRRSTRRSC